VQLKQPGNLPSNGNYRIEGGPGTLRDHRDLGAAHLPHLFLAQRCEVDAVEGDGSGLHPAGPADQPQDRKRRNRFSRTRLADQADNLAAADRQIDVVYGLDVAGVAFELDG
jgi:hypothetical protein